MADKKISELADVGALAAGDLIPLDDVSADETKSATAAELAAFVIDPHEAAANPHPTYTTDAEATTIVDDEIAGHAAIPGAHHAAVTIDSAADVLLGLAGQQIQLDAQNQNLVLAGPASGASIEPTFRALVDADIPAAIARDSEVTAAVGAHEAAGNPHPTYTTDAEATTIADAEVATHTALPSAHHAQLHAAQHVPGGGDAMTVDAAAATGSLRTLGTGATQAAAGTDSRLSDARVPTAHHTTHETGGSDVVAVTKSQVGLGNADNTSDANKPVSTAQQTAIDAKVADAINDGITTIAPSENAVFDALALKAPLASPTFTGTVTIPDPTNATDAASKSYVDSVATGLDLKASCRLATAAALPANLYANGSSGVGATLTGLVAGALTVDGVAVAVGDRVLVKDEAATENRGIYVVTTVGAVGILYVLTRAGDFDQAADLAEGDFTFIEEGTANAREGWVLTTAGPFTIGTTGLAFAQFNAVAEAHHATHEVAGSDAVAITHAQTTGQTATDHHAAPAAGPDADITVDTAGAAGTAATFARSGHGHKVATSATAATVLGAAAAGTSGHAPSRDDHVHNHGTGTVANAHAHGDLSSVGATDHHAAPVAGPDADIAIDTAGAAGTAATFARSAHGHEVVTTDAPSGANITVDAAASAAATGAIARAAHGHRLNTSASAAAAIGTAAAGTSGHSPSRDDHVHATGAGTPSTQAFGDAAATGSGPAAAMTDHKHAMPSERAAASTTPAAVGTAAVGTGTTDARADHVHATGAGTPSTQAFADTAATGTGPAAAMTDHKHAMPADPVTAHAADADPHTGYVLESLLDAKGDLIAASADNTPAKVTVGADDTILMADSAAAAGLKWVASAAPVAVGTANAVGTSDDFSRASHVHAHETAHVAHDTVWDAKGDLVVGTAADTAAAVTVGANDTILMADSAQTAGVKWVAPATPSTQAFGDAAAEGSADTFTRGDHKHAMPNSTAGPDADITIDASGAAGTASTAARAAHGHKLATSATAGAAIGTAAAGTSGHAPSRDDHVHPTGAGTPSTQAFGDAAATGTGPAASMTDHKHAMPALGTTPGTGALGDAAAGGTATTASKNDHVHGREAAAAQSDQETGTSTTLPVTPGRQHFHPSAAKCWGATTGGGSPSLTAGSYNVTSIADTAVGRLTVTIGTDFSSASFVGQVCGTAATALLKLYGMVTKAAGTVILESGSAATTLADVNVGFDWCFFGDQ